VTLQLAMSFLNQINEYINFTNLKQKFSKNCLNPDYQNRKNAHIQNLYQVSVILIWPGFKDLQDFTFRAMTFQNIIVRTRIPLMIGLTG